MQINMLKVQKKGLSYEDEQTHIYPPVNFKEGNARQLLFWATLYEQDKNELHKNIVYALHNYQKSSWRKGIKNWGDSRKNISDLKSHKKHIKEFENGNLNFFTNPLDNLTWEYGTKGITFVYLKLYDIFNDKAFLLEAQKGLKKICYTALDLRKEASQYNKIDLHYFNIVHYDSEQLNRKIFNDFFPKSLQFFVNISQYKSLPSIDIKNVSYKKSLNFCYKFLKEESVTLKHLLHRSMLLDILNYEKKKSELLYKFDNKALVRAEELSLIYSIEYLLNLDNNHFVKCKFVTSERILLCKIKFDWFSKDYDSIPLTTEKHMLLLRSSKGILENEISIIELSILQNFQRPISVEECIRNYFLVVDETNTVQIEGLLTKFYEVIKKLLYRNYIIPVSLSFSGR